VRYQVGLPHHAAQSIQLVDVKGKAKHVRVLNLLTAKQWIDLIDARSSRRTSAL
jgi:hypothetical protein